MSSFELKLGSLRVVVCFVVIGFREGFREAASLLFPPSVSLIIVCGHPVLDVHVLLC